MKRVSRHRGTQCSYIFKKNTYSLEKQEAGKVPVITKLAYPHRSSRGNMEEASSALLERKYPLPLATKATMEIKASTLQAEIIG